MLGTARKLWQYRDHAALDLPQQFRNELVGFEADAGTRELMRDMGTYHKIGPRGDVI